MRRLLPLFVPILLAGCGGGRAEVTGEALGITFGKSRSVYFGGPFIVIAQSDTDCEGLAFVRKTYEVGQVPTDDEVALLQFAFADVISVGQKSVDLGASVNATVVRGGGGAFDFEYAEAGVLDVDTYEDGSHVDGTFEGVTFADGVLDGEFSAEWCRNLKDR